MATDVTGVDAGLARFNQGCVAAVTGVAFAVQLWEAVPLVAVVLTVTGIGGHRVGLFSQVYERAIRPRRSTPIRLEPSAPPRFAMAVGSSALWVATAAFLLGATAVGWAVTLVVTAMSAFAAATSICVACRIYEGVAS